MPTKKFLILFAFLLVLGFGVVFALQSKKSDVKPSVQPITTTTVATAQTTSTPKVEEGCAIIPYSGKGTIDMPEINVDIRGGADCHFTINDNLPVFNFHLVGDSKNNLISKIEVLDGANNVPVQTLAVADGQPFTSDEEYFSTEDFNFDGYKDIKLLYSAGATGNTSYYVWLYDPAKKQFVENKDLSDLTSPTPDPATKTIKSYSVGGMAGCVYEEGEYRFDASGALQLLHSEIQDWDEQKNTFILTVGDLKNGQMVKKTENNSCGEI